MRPYDGAERTRREGLGFRRGLAAAALLTVLALAAPAAARYGDFDFWGRTWPLPIYVPVWSADAAVCQRIVKALNGARRPSLSLYSNKIFLRWHDHPAYPRKNGTEWKLGEDYGRWMEVPLFNDGRPVIALKVISPGAHFVQEVFYVFDDLAYYRSQDWLKGKLWEDPSVLQPIEPFLGKQFYTLMPLPRTIKDYHYWSLDWIGSDEETNIADFNGRLYEVIRRPSDEAILILYFSEERRGHAVCLIGPKKLVR